MSRQGASSWRHSGLYGGRTRRAALVVELESGERMLYEFVPGMPLTLETNLVEMYFDPEAAQELTVSGTLLRGTIWTGDVPQSEEPDAQRGELEERQREIER